jgi:hypothetical protein
VSINLLSHYKATGEPEMMERQLASFQEVIRRLNGKHLGRQLVLKILLDDLI